MDSNPGYNYSIHGVYKPTNITGGPHIVGSTARNWFLSNQVVNDFCVPLNGIWHDYDCWSVTKSFWGSSKYPEFLGGLGLLHVDINMKASLFWDSGWAILLASNHDVLGAGIGWLLSSSLFARLAGIHGLTLLSKEHTTIRTRSKFHTKIENFRVAAAKTPTNRRLVRWWRIWRTPSVPKLLEFSLVLVK